MLNVDFDAWRIRELVAQTCAELREVERRGWDEMRLAHLELAREELCALAVSTDEDEALDAAQGVISDIDALLGTAIDPLLARGAA